ncbi:flagellar hook-length control protein FliK [Undibacterium sp. Dicai25W]|uniref:flagellar hook-length control protein FliK n=1 Tax=Undibacterium sp. Dicai25W TaxID=3413034 RepID=UPI003BF2E7C7
MQKESQIGDIVDIRLNPSSIPEEASKATETSNLATGKSLTNAASEIKAAQYLQAGTNNNPNLSSQQSSVTVLSNFSKLIDILLRPSENLQSLHASTSKPMLTELTELQDTQKVSTLLHKEVSTSGVFYESHLADWVEGKKTIADLSLEPQSQLPTLNNSYAGLKTGENSPYKELTQIIQQQFHTLENNSLRWQGELIAGQKIEFEIRRDNHQKKPNQPKDNNETYWQSEVRFTLPSLGVVATKIQLSGNHLSVTIDTDLEATEKALRAHAPEFAISMNSIGTTLESFTVKHHDNDE